MLSFFRAKIPAHAAFVSVAICLFLISCCNFTFWHHTQIDYLLSKNNLSFLISLAVVISSFHYIFFVLFNFKYVFKPFAVFVLLLGAISAYAMDVYGYVISSNSYQNLFQSDSREMMDLFSFKLLAYLLWILAVPCLLLFRLKLKYLTWKQKLVHLLAAVLLITSNLMFYNKNYTSFLRNHKQLRYYINPTRPVYALFKYISEQVNGNVSHDLQILDPEAALVENTSKPRLIVLVIGEADRAMNQNLNGYKRQTNPLLGAREDIYSFKNVSSCGTETSVSVPCMFSAFSREDFTYAKGRYTENLTDLLQKTNVQVLWRDNDSGCKNVCDRIPVDDFNDAKIEPYCNSFECHDEVLLHKLQDYIDQKPGDKLIVLHKKGNHGPAYFKRYPEQFAMFNPVCKSNELQDCTNQEITNAYDNIIVYTDYFLNKLITQLEQNSGQYQTAMLYMSDHGESLGENGLYLHAMPYWLAPKEQTQIPFFFWASQDFALDREQLVQKLNQPLSHDNLFHSVIGLFDIQTKVYDKSLDIFAAD
jgi:lipid A ethanolaminephosphotransferase